MYKAIVSIGLASLLHCGLAAAVEVTASVDKGVVPVGGQLVLTVRVTGGAQGAEPSLRPSMVSRCSTRATPRRSRSSTA
ncbi:MAG: hypothetical protein NT045_09610 [Candidatus Aureabacteria bacterium]|nr:hypothetical protein [Candidatus Auribacterota bacterium]